MNNYIAVSYKLYVTFRGEEEKLQEQRTEDEPFIFITGIGNVLPPFEKHVDGLQAGDSVDFTIQPKDAFGEYDEQRVIELPVNSFLNEEGKLDERFFFEGNVVPMSDGQGGEYLATILQIGEEYVLVDLNHPRAGASMRFEGKVLEHRPATEEEVRIATEATQRHCGGCGGGCGGGGCGSCGDGSCGDGGCGCGGCS